MTDRFYQSLYFKLQDSKLQRSSKQVRIVDSWTTRSFSSTWVDYSYTGTLKIELRYSLKN